MARGSAAVLASFQTTWGDRPILVAVASRAECDAVLAGLGASGVAVAWRAVRASPRFEVVETGVGKAAAAGAVARTLDVGRHAAVLSVGIAGALPAAEPLAIGAVVAASHVVASDEGVLEPGGFRDLASMGFGPWGAEGCAHACDAELVRGLASLPARVGVIATVSTCSGTDAHAREIHARTGALAEAMEGAGVSLAAARLGVPMAELRVVSNTTGDRGGQRWDLAGALARLSDVMGRL